MNFIAFAIDASMGMVTLAIALGFYRIVRGPSLADRVVSLDMMTISIMAFCAVYSVKTANTAFVDVSIVVGPVGFLATVALARYAERQASREQHDDDRKPSEPRPEASS